RLLGEPERDVDELLDQEHADPIVRRVLERRDQALDDDRGEAERELVDEHELRPRYERLREHDHLLLAAREGARDRLPAGLEMREELDGVLDPALRVLARKGIGG